MSDLPPLAIRFEYSRGVGRLSFDGPLVAGWEPEDRTIEPLSEWTFQVAVANLQADLVLLRQALSLAVRQNGAEQAVGDALYNFYLCGWTFWRRVIGEWRTERLLTQLGSVLDARLPGEWWRKSPESIAKNVGEIEVSGRRDVLLPIDTLPVSLGCPSQRRRWDAEDVLYLASLFGGYHAVVRFVSHGQITDDDRPRALSRSALPLPQGTDIHSIVYFRSEEAVYYDRMELYLADGWHVLGPYPCAEDLQDGARIAALLLNPEPLPNDPTREQRVPAIAHAHAHAISGAGSSQQLIVEFVYDERRSHLTSLHVADALRASRTYPSDSCGLVVVFSACHAMGGVDRALVSTALDLAEGGCRAVVGSRDAVPAGVAYAVSRVLFAALAGRRALGRALVEAKWTLMSEWHNPLGLLYTIYGDTGPLRVSSEARS